MPLSGFALGLGEIEVDTFLNQPLKAEIEVVAARPGEVDDLLVSLASREAFRKAGLQRPANLSKLRFKVEKSEDGESARILITTKTPIKEPFLNFLVEADWAKGRLLREFTILLDPPTFAQQSQPAPVTEAAPIEPVQQATPPPRATSEEVTPAPIAEIIPPEPYEPDDTASQPIALTDEPEPGMDSEPFMPDMAFGGDQEIVVEKGDTLWGIASQFKDEEHSMAQVMLAMQMMNPEAFGDGNINNLKVGAVLRAPDAEALDRFGRQEAYAQVLEQNGLWDEYVARRTGVSTDASPQALDSDSAMVDESMAMESDAQLSLLTPGEGESTSASLQTEASSSADSGQIRKQLALAEEELEAARLENEDLKSRVADLEQQIGKFEELQKLVAIEDDSLAQLQQNITEQQDAADSMKEDMEVMVEQPTQAMVDAADQMMQDKSDTEQPAMDEEMVSDVTGPIVPLSEDAMVEDAITQESATMEMAEEQTAEADTMMDMTAPEDALLIEEGPVDEQEEVVAPPPAPVIVTEPATPADEGILGMLPPLESLLSDPVMLGGMGAILALLIGLLFVRRKKAAEEEEADLLLDEADSLVDEDETPIHVPSVDDPEVKEDTFAATDDNLLIDTAVMDADEGEQEPEIEKTNETEFDSTAVLDADEKPVAQAAVGDEQDDVLNEVDVYLAYGLYENAEELLNESLAESPDRADYRAKLLDTHFATKNRDGFVKEAEALKSLGGGADRYWDRVQIMGYELDPSNDLFSGAKDSEMSVSDLEYAKPQTADFDLGSEEDITDFSSTDFDLDVDVADDDFDASSTKDVVGAEDFDDGSKEITDTMTMPPPDNDGIEATDNIELPDLMDADETVMREEETSEIDKMDLPDEIGDFDLDLGESEAAEEEPSPDRTAEKVEELDDDALNFDLPDDLDLATEDETEASEDDSLIPLEPTLQTDHAEGVPPMAGDEEEIESTDNLNIVFDDEEEQDRGEIIDLEDEISETVAVESISEETLNGTKHIEAALDLDMSDMDNADLETGNFEPVETSDDITEFKPAEITGEFTAYEGESSDEMPPVEELDANAGVEKTGTFAPGDFDDEDDGANADDVDDISDLMLPDDVDEVSTKLDLAKAFIDMGDAEGARSSLEEVLDEGTEEQKAEATDLMQKIS